MTNAWTRVAAFGLVLVLAACGGGGSEDLNSVAREGPAGVRALSAPNEFRLDCAGCGFGPQTFVRGKGAPSTTHLVLMGDPLADYRVEITDNATQGADAVVNLDSAVLLSARQPGDTLPRSAALDIKLSAASTLSIRLLGKLGSTLTVTIRGGAKAVGPQGGSVVMPGGTARVELPPSALDGTQVITVEPAPDDQRIGRLGNFAVRIGPEGLTFAVPVSVVAKYKPSFLPVDVDPSNLRLGFLTDNDVTEIDSEVDEVEGTVRARTTHFSTWVLSAIKSSEYRGPNWGNPQTRWSVSSGCLRRSASGKTKDIEALSKALFNLPGSVNFDSYVGNGCVTEPYFADGYSQDTYPWDVNNTPIGLENHAGVDFRARTPVPVYAVAPGVVKVAALNAAIGRSTLIIESQIASKTYWVFYLHCSTHSVSVSSSVRAGQQVCLTGSVGSAAPHLHFEVKLKGGDLDASGLDWERALSGSHCPGGQFYSYSGTTGGFDKLSAGCPKAQVALRTVDPVSVLQVASACLASAPPSGTLPYLRMVCVDDGSCPPGEVAVLIGGNNAANPQIPRVRYCAPR